MDPQGSIKDPNGQKKSPNCADDAPVRGARASARARATYGSIINKIGLTVLPSCGLLPAKAVKSNAKCVIHMV